MEESVSWLVSASQQDGPGSGPDWDGGRSQSAGEEQEVIESLLSGLFFFIVFLGLILMNHICSKKEQKHEKVWFH